MDDGKAYMIFAFVLVGAGVYEIGVSIWLGTPTFFGSLYIIAGALFSSIAVIMRRLDLLRHLMRFRILDAMSIDQVAELIEERKREKH